MFLLTVLNVNAFAQANTSLSNLITTSLNQDLVFGTTSGTHYMKTNGSDNLVLQTGPADIDGFGGGFNVFAGSSVQIQAGGDGVMNLSTSNTSDIDVNSAGSTVVMTGTGYSTYVYSESLQLYTDHGLQLSQTDTKPTCDDSRRGTLYYNANADGVADTLQICMKSSSDTYAWHTVP